MMRFEHRYHYDLTPAKIDQLIAASKGEKLLPTRGEVARSAGGAAEKPKPKPRTARKKKADA